MQDMLRGGGGATPPPTGGGGLGGYVPAPGDFRLTGGTPTLTGSTNAHPSTRNPTTTMTIEGQRIDFNATIDWLNAAAATPGDVYRAGMRQTVTSVQRDLVYRSPDGTEFTDRTAIPAPTRDTQTYEDDGAEVDGIFYHRTDVASSQLVAPSRTHATVGTWDQPDMPAPLRMGDATLVGVRGSDAFVSTYSVRGPGGSVDLRSFNWRIPWNMTLNAPNVVGTPTVVTPAAQHVEPTQAGIATARITDHALHFDSVAEVIASGLSTPRLVEAFLRAHAANDPAAATSAAHIAAALTQRNPALHVTVAVDQTASDVGDDELVIAVAGHRRAQSGELGAGDHSTVSFDTSFNSVVDAARLGEGSTITITAQDRGLVSSEPRTFAWHQPFEDASAVSMAGPSRRNSRSQYRVSVRW
jgi:hypothetical protein